MVAIAKPDNNILAFPQKQQKSNEWYTPARYVDAARLVMGGIDLDPASCKFANETVKASRYYTKEDDGLTQEWYGRVWLNPPYGKDNSLPNQERSTIRKWVEKLLDDYSHECISQAILLVTCQINAKWFDLLWNYPICFVNHNIRFHVQGFMPSRPGRTTESHTYGTIFVYLGPNESRFVEVFSQFGRIAKAIDTPKPAPTTLWEVQA